MRASTASMAIALSFAAPPALPFDQDEFCIAATHVADRMNARRGKWLDRSTRFDGVEIVCDTKTLDVNRYINTDPDDMRKDWEKLARRLNGAPVTPYAAWREAID